jgi:outer membrane protein OmpA-like peptidoglycan-associated protein
MNGVGVGDPRIGLLVRIFGQPDASPFSLSLGGQVWVPLRKFTDSLAPTSSDQDVRVLPKLVLGGYGHHVRWSFTGAFLYRPEARLGTLGPEGSTAGSELQFGAAISYADKERRFAIGPEAMMATMLIPNNAFKPDATSLEVLLGAHYNVANQVQLGLGGGIGLLRQPGTPDFRMLLRVAYAPIRKGGADRDRDGIADSEDACPDDPGVRTGNPRTNGCPPDRDGDGIFDSEDQCPDTPQGLHPDPQKRGCPASDRDGDGVLDGEDLCPDTPQGPTPDPQKKGCPAGDKDGDGVYDFEDQCPEVPAGLKPDPQKKGCPLPDRDHDTVIDSEDACPDQPGAPNPDPKKNGCPGLVAVESGKITILQPVFFATNKDTILKKSHPLLTSLADALKASPQLKKIRIEGYSDDRGKRDYNVELSDRRARSVMKWLVEHGVAEARLEAKGFGPENPVASNKTAKGRAANRRVDFVIIDPPQPAASKPVVEAPEVVDRDPDKKGHHLGHHRHKGGSGSEGQAPAAGAGAAEDADTPHPHHRRHNKDAAAAAAAADAEQPTESGKPHKHHRHHKSTAPAEQ